jgi:hypothetical protein
VVVPEIHTRIVVSDLTADLIAALLAIVAQLLAILDAAGPIIDEVSAAIAEIRANARPDAGADPDSDARSVGDAASRTGGKLRWSVASARSRGKL